MTVLLEFQVGDSKAVLTFQPASKWFGLFLSQFFNQYVCIPADYDCLKRMELL